MVSVRCFFSTGMVSTTVALFLQQLMICFVVVQSEDFFQIRHLNSLSILSFLILNEFQNSWLYSKDTQTRSHVSSRTQTRSRVTSNTLHIFDFEGDFSSYRIWIRNAPLQLLLIMEAFFAQRRKHPLPSQHFEGLLQKRWSS